MKRTLAAAREQTERLKSAGAAGRKESVVTLTRSDGKGGHHPLPAPRYGEESLKGARGKGKKNQVDTHQAGQRVRYFADDDKFSLNEMVRTLQIYQNNDINLRCLVVWCLQFQREKLNTAEDQNGMFSRLAGNKLEQTNDDFDVDDMFESRAQRGVDTVKAEARDRERAIEQHEKRERILDSCVHCFDSPVCQPFVFGVNISVVK